MSVLSAVWPAIVGRRSREASEIRLRQFSNLATQTPMIAAGNAVCATFTVVVLSDIAPKPFLFFWCLTLLLASALNLLKWFRHRRRPTPTHVSPRSIQKTAVLAAVIGGMWGLAAVVLFPLDSYTHQIFIAFVIGGMSAAAVAALSALPVACIGFMVPSLTPLVARFAMEGTTLSLAMAGMATMFGAALVLFARNGYASFLASVRIGLENQDLLDQLTQAQVQLTQAIEAISEGFAYYDSDDRLVICNSKYRDLHVGACASVRPGAKFEDIIRAGAERGCFPEAVGRVDAWVKERLKRRRNPQGMIERELADGTWLRVTERRTQSGGMVGVRTDITELKRREAELWTAKEQAERANHAKSEFLATMSHEVRTPMNGVLGMAGLLLDTKMSAEQRRYAEAIRESGEALLVIINDILDFSKLEAGRLELEIVEFDLAQMIDSVIEVLAPRAIGKGIEPAAFVDPRVPPLLRGDPGRLRQILLNLMGNAIKFTETGGVAVEVTLRQSKNQTALLQFDVADSGIGIAKKDKERLFMRFTQADSSSTRRHGGTGLGLAICSELVELMDGEIGVVSTPGAGSTFWFTIRLAIAAEAGEEKSSAAPALTGRRVLVVDDNEINRRIFCKQTEAAGMAATPAADGKAALAALDDAARAGSPFDVALIDYFMPGLDGGELARRIRDEPEHAGLKLVLVTAAGMRSENARVSTSGFDAYLAKPVSQSLLVDCLLRMTKTPGSRKAAPVEIKDPSPERDSTDMRVQPLRVLLAEDNQVNQLVAATMLRKEGYRVDVVSNGQEALEAVGKFPYDVVLMDVQMPEMDGVEATARIRTMVGDRANVPVIALTANAMAGDREKYLAAGMDDYVSKPVDKAKLMAAIARWSGGLESPPPEGNKDSPAPMEVLAPEAEDALKGLLKSMDEMGKRLDGTPNPEASPRKGKGRRRACA